jgi:hypothetical protein
MHFSAFQDIYSGCCTVAAQTLRLDQSKVGDDRYSSSRLKATRASIIFD